MSVVLDIHENEELRHAKAFLDGVELSHCFRLCPAEGWADVYETENGGRRIALTPDGLAPATKRVHGRVYAIDTRTGEPWDTDKAMYSEGGCD